MTRLLVTISILALPLYVWRWVYFGKYPTTFLELTIWGLLLTWCISKIYRREKISWPSKTICLITLGVLIAGSVAVLHNPDRWSAWGIWRAYFLEPILVGLVAHDLMSRNGSNITRIWFALVGTATWLGTLGILQVVFSWPIVTSHQWDRAHAVFNNGNALALFIGPILAVIIYERLTSAQTRRILSWSIAILLTSALVLTKSAGAMTSLAVTVTLIAVVRYTCWQKTLTTFFIGTTVLFLVFLSQIHNFTPKSVNPWSRSDGTWTVRLCIWEGTYNLLLDQPVFGAGLANFQRQYAQSYFTCDAEPVVHPHNFFLNFWADTGLGGLLAFSTLFLFILAKPDNKFSFAFVYQFVHGLVDVPYFKNDLAVSFWILVAFWCIEELRLSSGGNRT